MTNQDYKNASLNALKGHWAEAVVATIIFVLLYAICTAPSATNESRGSLTCLLLSVFVGLPLLVGFMNSFRLLYETGDTRVASNTFNVGFKNYLHNVGGYLLMEIFISLWTLLLVVPGLIKTYSYAMTPYILAEHPELSANQAIEESMRMMDGHKFDLFYLHLSFIGWVILCIITLGIGFLWLAPYVYTAQAAFYKDLKSQQPVA